MLEKFGLAPTGAKSVKSGDVFGRLTVLATGQIPGTYRYMAVCQCSCGSDAKAVRFDGLSSGFVVGCGCVQKEQSTTHSLSSSPHYGRWWHMMDRCGNPDSKSYPDYGGRGISVCQSWHDIRNFVSGLPDGYFSDAEIDRIDNDGDYEPGNVRWATKSENCDNRRTGQYIAFNGKTQSVTAWAKETGINAATLRDRIFVSGWTAEKALTHRLISASEAASMACDLRWANHKAKPKPVARDLTVKRFSYLGKDLSVKELSELKIGRAHV